MVSERDLDEVLRGIRETGVDLTMHESLTPDRVLGRLREAKADGEHIGFCRRCGAEDGAIERDAIRRECPECGEETVEGADEMMMRVAVIESIRKSIRERQVPEPTAEGNSASERATNTEE